MEYFEQKALSTAPTPRLWWRYVDDTFVIQNEVNKQDFLQHINSIDPVIQFKVENNNEDAAIPFSDIVKPEADGNLFITVYKKPTQTSICSGTATITSQQNVLLLIPSPIGPKQCVAILSFSTKKWIIMPYLFITMLFCSFSFINKHSKPVTQNTQTFWAGLPIRNIYQWPSVGLTSAIVLMHLQPF